MSAARERIERLQRIERLRRRLHELAAWRHAAIAHERDKLTEAHGEMLAALGDGMMAYGPPAAAGARRVRAIERDIAIAESIALDLQKRAQDDGRKAKLAEDWLESARLAHRETQERKSLEELVEASLRDSGPRKP